MSAVYRNDCTADGVGAGPLRWGDAGGGLAQAYRWHLGKSLMCQGAGGGELTL
jgi:hypothetical protein